jgi:hypothetical protein
VSEDAPSEGQILEPSVDGPTEADCGLDRFKRLRQPARGVVGNL